MIEDILAESWAFRELREKALGEGRAEGMQQGLKQGMQQGRKEGRKEGRKQGLKQGMQQGLKQGVQQGREEALLREVQRQRQILLAFVRARFPSLEQVAEERCKALNNPEQLQALILNVGLAQGEQEVKKCLLNGN